MSFNFDKEVNKVERVKWEIVGANILEVEVGTNCPKGGDWGHGGRTYFRLKDMAGTTWFVRIKDRIGDIYITDPKEIEILLGGDSEWRTFRKALLFGWLALGAELSDLLEDIIDGNKELEVRRVVSFLILLHQIVEDGDTDDVELWFKFAEKLLKKIGYEVVKKYVAPNGYIVFRAGGRNYRLDLNYGLLELEDLS